MIQYPQLLHRAMSPQQASPGNTSFAAKSHHFDQFRTERFEDFCLEELSRQKLLSRRQGHASGMSTRVGSSQTTASGLFAEDNPQGELQVLSSQLKLFENLCVGNHQENRERCEKFFPLKAVEILLNFAEGSLRSTPHGQGSQWV